VQLLQRARTVDDPAQPRGQDVHDVADRHQHEDRGERELDGLGDHGPSFAAAPGRKGWGYEFRARPAG
jgi:hypothetical protein